MRKTCFNMIYELAKKDKRIVYIGSDVGSGTLQQMKEEMPDQFYMEGIQEQNIIGMATGLALSGKIVYVNTIATFLTRRCFEQVLLDVGRHNAKVRLLANGGGLVYSALGHTHVAPDDIALMRTIPNMTIVCPCDADEMKRLMPQTVDYPGPMYIRFGGDAEVVDMIDHKIGEGVIKQWGTQAIIITTGTMLQVVMGIPDVTIVYLPRIKPLNPQIPIWASLHPKVVTVEEHYINGGLGTAVLELLNEHGINKPVKRIGIPEGYCDLYGTREEQLKYYGITTEAIERAILSG